MIMPQNGTQTARFLVDTDYPNISLKALRNACFQANISLNGLKNKYKKITENMDMTLR